MLKINRVSLSMIIIAMALLINSFFVFAGAGGPSDPIGPLYCEITEACAYTDVLHMLKLNNSHAEFNNNSNYPYSVCCVDAANNVDIGIGCSGTYSNQYQNITNLNKVNNSHVEMGNYSNYPHRVCLNTTDGYLFCNYSTSCENYETCLFTFYNYTNSHIGNCDIDGIKVCCNLDECIANTDCEQEEYCWGGDCYINETITINNLGQTGFEQTNQEYTSSRAVVLSLTYNIETVTGCRYSNNMETWSSWEQCQPFKFWYLSQNDGLKTVYYQINRSGDDLAIRSDTITLESEGRYLDVTKPSYPIVKDEGNYTNNNNSLYAYWYGANDPELYFIGKKLEYAYRIYDNTTESYLNNSWKYVGTSIYVNATNLSLKNNHTYTFEVRVNNSANLTNSSMSDGIIVDTEAPNITLYSIHSRNEWSSNNTIYFNWTVSESTLKGFSYVFDSINNSIPDKVIDIGLWHIRNNTQIPSNDGTYYYHIRAKDLADNWGLATHYGWIGIDTTPPHEPDVLNPQQFATSNNLSFSWTTYDESSGVVNVSLNVTEINGSTIFFRWLGNVTNYNITNATINKSYFATVTAKDKVGLTRQSKTILDLNAPKILFSKPNGSINKDPIIVLITDEQAICYFNNTRFTYTNSTYHETRLRNLQDGAYQLNIKCTDMVGYTTIHNLDFTLIKGLDISLLNLETPENKFVNDVLNLTISTDLGEIRKGEINLFVNNQRYNDFTIFDKGKGNYSLFFKLEKPGTYNINVSIDNLMARSSLTINDLLLVINYSEPLNTKNKTRLTYADTSYYTLGIASESDTVNVRSNSTILKLESQIDSNSYIFMTKTGQYLEQKINHLESKTFKENMQAFGYSNNQKNENKIITEYNNIVIVNSLDEYIGRNNLLLKNLGLNNKNQTMIDINLKND